MVMEWRELWGCCGGYFSLSFLVNKSEETSVRPPFPHPPPPRPLQMPLINLNSTLR